MVDWIVEAALPLAPDPLVIVASPDTATAFPGRTVAIQERSLGTGDAVRSAREALDGADDVLILSGDTPLLTTALLEELVETHRSERAGATVLSFVPADIRSYGRIVRDSGGHLESIVEAVDATPGAATDRRGELVDLRLPRRAPLAGARQAAACQCAG